MPDEQHETLTLDDLLGLSGGPSERTSEGGFGMLQDSSELLRELVGAEEAAPLSLDNLPSLPKIPAGLVPVELEKTEPESQLEPAPAKEAVPEVGEALRTKQEPKQKARPEQCLKPNQQPKQKQKQKAKPKQATELSSKSEPKQQHEPEFQQDKSESASARLCETSCVPHEPRFVRKGKHARGEAKDRAFSGKHAASSAAKEPEQQRADVAAPKPAQMSTSKYATETTPKPVTRPVQAAASGAASGLAESSSSRLERLNELSRRLESQILASSETFRQAHEKVEIPADTSTDVSIDAAADALVSTLVDTPISTPASVPADAPADAPAVASATDAPVDTSSSHEQSLPEWCAEASPEESPLFDEPPQTIAEGMQDGQREHRRIIRIKIALGAMAALLVVACAVGLAQQLMVQPDAQNPQTTQQLDAPQNSQSPDTSNSPESPDGEHQSNASGQPNSATNSATNPGDHSITPNQPQTPQQDRSGTVVYRYVTNNATGTDCTITETVTFNQEGLCETSDMEVKLADEAAAEAFAQVMQRDYGPDAEVSVEGSTVRAHLTISSNDLDREAYEDALRASVRDLTIVKKS